MNDEELGKLIPGLAKPWAWIQPKNDAELVRRLCQARDYRVHERERENLCSVAASRLHALTSAPDPDPEELYDCPIHGKLGGANYCPRC